MEISVFSPAKLNLFLAITGRRADGFHDLVSVACPLAFGDELTARATPASAGKERFTLDCDAPGVPTDASNLVLRAARAYAEAVPDWREAVHFVLTKRVPSGAGLGGGSSNAVATLRALDALAGAKLGTSRLAELAAGLGSDCALFLRPGPVVMRGRGERIADAPETAAARLRGRRVVVFKPSFSIGTAWAYARLAARGTDYLAAPVAEERWARWGAGTGAAEELLYNNFEPLAFEKFVALPLLLATLRREFGVAAGMSGSGSACFALLRDDTVTAPLVRRIRACWGEVAFVQETRLA